MTFKEFFSFRKNLLLWGNLLAIAILAILIVVGIWIGLATYTRHGQAVEIPTVKGLGRQDAINLIHSRRLIPIVSDSIYIKGMAAGQIVRQDPEAGAQVKEGRVVYLTVNSLNVPTTRMPDIANNSSLRQAMAKLTSSGFRLTEEEYIQGDKDWVYEVKMNGRSIQSGEPVPIGATLTLVVGKGQPEAMTDDSTAFFYGDPFGTEDPEDIDGYDNPGSSRSETDEGENPATHKPAQPTRKPHEDSWF